VDGSFLPVRLRRVLQPHQGGSGVLAVAALNAGRWIAAAREAGYLGASEGMGKAGG
jgi:hypothetical protein